MLRRVFPILLGLVMMTAVGCDGEDITVGLPTGGQPPGGQQTFVAAMMGGSEVPPVTTSATGSATFIVQGLTVEFTIVVEDIQNVTAAHIHTGEAGVNGPIVVPLFAAAQGSEFSGSGTLVTGTFEESDIVPGPGISYDELVTRMGDGTLYTNVHTTANEAGEIRGQIESL